MRFVNQKKKKKTKKKQRLISQSQNQIKKEQSTIKHRTSKKYCGFALLLIH